jgi:hypothetical protein
MQILRCCKWPKQYGTQDGDPIDKLHEEFHALIKPRTRTNYTPIDSMQIDVDRCMRYASEWEGDVK